jgi:hypothetical protein
MTREKSAQDDKGKSGQDDKVKKGRGKARGYRRNYEKVCVCGDV